MRLIPLIFISFLAIASMAQKKATCIEYFTDVEVVDSLNPFSEFITDFTSKQRTKIIFKGNRMYRFIENGLSRNEINDSIYSKFKGDSLLFYGRFKNGELLGVRSKLKEVNELNLDTISLGIHKDILGYKCVAFKLESDKDSTIYWYTNKFKLPYADELNMNGVLSGVVLEKETFSQGVIITRKITCLDKKFRVTNELLFKAPKGYCVLSYSELRERMKNAKD